MKDLKQKMDWFYHDWFNRTGTTLIGESRLMFENFVLDTIEQVEKEAKISILKELKKEYKGWIAPPTTDHFEARNEAFLDNNNYWHSYINYLIKRLKGSK